MRAELAALTSEQQHTTKLLHAQLTKQLAGLDTKESNLIDLAADGGLPKGKIRAKLHEITLEREQLTARLNSTDHDLSATAELIEACLTLLDNPLDLYQRCNPQQRKQLNQALFHELYVEEEGTGNFKVTHSFKEPFDALYTAYASTPPPAPGTQATAWAVAPGVATGAPKSALPHTGEGAKGQLKLADLLGYAQEVSRSNCRTLVEAIEALAHPCKPADRLFKLAATWPDSLTQAKLHRTSIYRTARPLDESVVKELVKGYQAGAGVKQLAKQFGISRETVGKHLAAHGINTREPKLTPDQIQEAAQLYRDGWSLAKLGTKYGANDGTIRSRLLEVGVVMRPRRGGRQRGASR